MDETRFTLNLGSLAIKSKSKYPLIVDPSHAAGNRDYVISMAKGAIAAGADGLMIEVHLIPKKPCVTDLKRLHLLCLSN